MTYRRLSANAIARDDGAVITRRWLRREPDEPRRCVFVAHGPPALLVSPELGTLLEELSAHGINATVRPLVGVYETADEAREAI